MSWNRRNDLESLEPRRLLSTTIRIMPLGDSITEAFAPSQSYRYWLWNSLKNAGYANVDFVGSMSGVNNGQPADGNFAQNHEGHTGWTADQILEQLPGWAASTQPDVVLLHAGTNDIRTGQSIESTINDLGHIIDTLRSVNPKVTILVSQIIPDSDTAAAIAALDDQIPSLVAGKQDSVSKLIVVDQEQGFDINADSNDGIHPNAQGEQKMAGKFFNALKTILPSPTAQTPSNTTYLSKLGFISSTNEEGPIERDQSNGGDGEDDGTRMSIGGIAYNRGLGTSGNSRIDIRLNGRQRYFASDIGIDDEVGTGGSVVFKVYADGKRIFCSNIMTGADGRQQIKFLIKGVRRLTLIVSNAGDGSDRDHADWANARVIV